MKSYSQILIAGTFLITAIFSFMPQAAATDIRIELTKFKDNRAAMMLAFSKPVATCVALHDTDEPVFHGCEDWHSAVHGLWALAAYTWATGDHRYESLIDSTLQPELVAKERQHLLEETNFEMPYGRTWFLRLAIDYRRAFHSDRLDAMADDVAKSLMVYYSNQKPDPLSLDYQDATWTLINLYDYGVVFGKKDVVDFVESKTKAYYMNEASCDPQGLEVSSGQFMGVCAQWAWLVSRIQSEKEFKPWLAAFFPGTTSFAPITAPQSGYQVGLNFSRAWGYWGVYRKSGDTRFAKAYLANLNENYSHPDFWIGGYDEVGHWVAQFGMMAIMVTYYDWPQSIN